MIQTSTVFPSYNLQKQLSQIFCRSCFLLSFCNLQHVNPDFHKSSHPIPMNANNQLAVISNFPKVLSSLFPAHRSRKTSCGRRGLRTKSGANSSPARYRAGVGWRGTNCPAGRRPKTGGAWGTFRRGISPPSQTDHPVAAQCRAGKLPDLHASGRAGAQDF